MMKCVTETDDFYETRITSLRKLSTPLISDVMNKSGIEKQIISGISPLKKGTKICGKAFTALYANNEEPSSALFEHNRYLLDEIPANQSIVLLIANKGTPNIASSWGFLVSLYARQKGISGTITNGCARDCAEIADLDYPVFCTGAHSQNSNQSYKVISLQTQIQLNGIIIYPGDFILADDSGIAVIPCSIIDKILTLANQKQQDEMKIAKFMNNGLTLREIDEIMRTNQQKHCFSKNSLFSKEKNNNSEQDGNQETMEKSIFIKSCL